MDMCESSAGVDARNDVDVDKLQETAEKKKRKQKSRVDEKFETADDECSAILLNRGEISAAVEGALLGSSSSSSWSLCTERTSWTYPLMPSAESIPHAGPASSSPRPAISARALQSGVRSVCALEANPVLLAFVSRGGRALLCDASKGTPVIIPFPTQSVTRATAITLFRISSNPSSPPFVAVAYACGAVAVFVLPSLHLVHLARPFSNSPIHASASVSVRTLRYVPCLHWGRTVDREKKARANQSDEHQGALFAVFGVQGNVALLRNSALRHVTCPSSSSRTASLETSTDPSSSSWTVWTLRGVGAVLDAIPVGADPRPICEIDLPPSEAFLRVISGGVSPAIAAHACGNEAVFSARNAAKKAASSVLSFARGFLSSGLAALDAETFVGGSGGGTSNSTLSNSVKNGISSGQMSDLNMEDSVVVANATLCSSWNDHSTSATTGVTALAGNTASQFGRRVVDAGASASREVGAVLARQHRRLMRARSALDGDSDLETSVPVPEPVGGSADSASLERLLGAELRHDARIVEFVSAAPLQSGLFATCDSLGRVFVQDARDMCVLRVLKGYRDVQIAWAVLKKSKEEGSDNNRGIVLVTLAPKLNVLEVHRPLKENRIAAFRVPRGSRLVQTSDYGVFVLAPTGTLYELSRFWEASSIAKPSRARGKVSSLAESRAPAKAAPVSASDAETISAFLNAAREGQIGRAVEFFSALREEPEKIAHLMAMLVTCADGVSADVHAALAARARQLASETGARDLATRYSAHRRLALAYSALEVRRERDENDVTQDQEDDGLCLRDDALGAGLIEIPGESLPPGRTILRNLLAPEGEDKQRRGRRKELPEKSGMGVEQNGGCGRFILAHVLCAHAVENGVSSEDEGNETFPIDNVESLQSSRAGAPLQPREDLSRDERNWLPKLYFSRLLVRERRTRERELLGREQAPSRDVFVGLHKHLSLRIPQIAALFVTFFLTADLDTLLRTPLPLHESAVRTFLARIRSSSRHRRAVDEIILGACETTNRVCNAALLIRLCISDISSLSPTSSSVNPITSEGVLGAFLEVLERLHSALQFRRLVAGTDAHAEACAHYTAQHSTGARGDAERQAVALLTARKEFEAASHVLRTLPALREPPLREHECAAAGEAAVEACRVLAARTLNEEGHKVLPESVSNWIREVEGEARRNAENEGEANDVLEEEDIQVQFKGIRSVLLAAHSYLHDASVHAVRCLQLAEAMSTLLPEEKRDEREGGEQNKDITYPGDVDLDVEDEEHDVVDEVEKGNAEKKEDGDGNLRIETGEASMNIDVSTEADDMQISQQERERLDMLANGAGVWGE